MVGDGRSGGGGGGSFRFIQLAHAEMYSTDPCVVRAVRCSPQHSVRSAMGGVLYNKVCSCLS